MCVENYGFDIQETIFDPCGDTDGWWAARHKKALIRIGLRGDVPEWLIWRMEGNHSPVWRRTCRRRARTKMNQELQRAISQGVDFEDFHLEGHSHLFDRLSDWY